jgi:Zn-dependent protease with chaperone function
VASDTSDPDERRLLNVVEEMSIASGTPVPGVYVLDGEDGINAFAAGTPSTTPRSR